MVVSLTQEFHTARICQFLETVKHFRSVSCKLLNRRTGNGKRYLKFPFVLLNSIQKEFIHRKIALLCYPLEDGPVSKIVVVMRIRAYIEETIQTESCWLMDLKIKAD